MKEKASKTSTHELRRLKRRFMVFYKRNMSSFVIFLKRQMSSFVQFSVKKLVLLEQKIAAKISKTKYKEDYDNLKIKTASLLTRDQLKSTWKNNKPMIKMLLGLVILFALVFGYKMISGYLQFKAIEASSHPAVTVSATKAQKEEWESLVKASASARAIHGVDVTTSIGGMVKSRLFSPGTEVKKDDLLVELNSDLETWQLHSLEAARDLAEITLTRDRKQLEIKAVSQAVVDSDEASLRGKSADVEAQKALIAKKNIRAPFDGQLGISLINLGQYLNPGDKIVTLQSLDPIYIDFYVPQQTVHKVHLNDDVTVVSDALPNEEFTGVITAINPIADYTSRNIQIEATIANPRKDLLPGMYCNIAVKMGQSHQYITLPLTAISFNPYGELVYLIKETGKDKSGEPILTVTQNFVKLGERRGDQIAVLEGVKEGDWVVTAGQLKLKNNSRVRINNSVLPKNDPSPNPPEE